MKNTTTKPNAAAMKTARAIVAQAIRESRAQGGALVSLGTCTMPEVGSLLLDLCTDNNYTQYDAASGKTTVEYWGNRGLVDEAFETSWTIEVSH